MITYTSKGLLMPEAVMSNTSHKYAVPSNNTKVVLLIAAPQNFSTYWDCICPLEAELDSAFIAMESF